MGCLFGLFTLPFKLIYWFFKVIWELIEHLTGHQHRHPTRRLRRHQSPVQREANRRTNMKILGYGLFPYISVWFVWKQLSLKKRIAMGIWSVVMGVFTFLVVLAISLTPQQTPATVGTAQNTVIATAAPVQHTSNTASNQTSSQTANQVASTPLPSAAPATSNNASSPVSKSVSPLGRANPLAGVYHPYRLHVVAPLKTVSGTVEIVRHEPDHDYHINLKLDPQYSNLINSKNTQYEHGDLVVEVIPMDQHDVPIPTVGEHITVTGAYVNDADHGWMEIHPAWFINGHGSAAYTSAAAAASVQTGLAGNGDEGTGLTTGTPVTSTPNNGSNSGLSLVSFTQNVYPGAYASITVHGTPGTTATIEVDYSSGPSHASGLIPEQVDSNGDVTWQWKVGTRTTAGNWPVHVFDAGKELTETLNVQ